MKLKIDYFLEMKLARENGTMKAFAADFKDSYNISLSIRDIREFKGFGENVYNNLEKFEEYLSLLQFGKEDNVPAKEVETKEVETKEVPTVTTNKKVESTETKISDSKNIDLVTALKNAIGETRINEDRVIELIKEHSNVQIETKYINEAKETSHNIKIKHFQFDTLLALIASGCNVWLTGGAGGGKTHSTSDVAKVLGLDFYTKSISAQTSEFSFFGFINAAGNFVETDFYNAYTKGGLFCIDEIDNGSPNLLSVLNSALANGKCSFANGTQTRHKDFICVATANTIGRGGNQKYVGRLQIDAATLDRFALLNWDYDTNLEDLLSGNKEVSQYVQKLRNKAIDNNLNCVISPRASIAISKLVANGMKLEDAANYCIFNKLTENELNLLK
jgi:cobaltochelatase CobS